MNISSLVSVIIPTKNSKEFLKSCLKSVKNQSYKNIEIIVVDNNSADDTKKIAEDFRRKTKETRISIYNKGPERSAQRNFGVRKARGNYFYFVDSDFVLEKNVIKECIEKISVGFDAIVVHNSPDTKVSWIAKIRKFEVDMYKYDLTHSAARFFKKSIFLKIGGYSEIITAGEDYDIQNKLNRNKFKTGFIEEEAIHLGEPTSLLKHMLKYYKYGKDFVNYQRENKKESREQLTILRGVYFKNWKNFVYHPFLGAGFFFYTLIKFIFTGAGYLIAKYF
jgi:glycosyltransferase involved in cell wall biosynthesis